MNELEIKPIKPVTTILFFGAPAILLWAATHYGIDFVCWLFGVNDLLSWVIIGGIFYFLLFLTSLIIIKKEGTELKLHEIKKRLRLNPISKQDWEWTFIGFMLVLVLSALIVYFRYALTNQIYTVPSFLDIKPLKPNELWILAIWLVNFFFNVIGEEFLWRGYILTRQQLSLGKYSWLANGLLWTLFYFSFGIDMLINMLPFFFVIPFIVQKRKNTWTGIIIHAAVKGPAFIFVALSMYNFN
ncbi:CPBP family intramembrane glutamic endopeptidase [Melioribacteraceae bacterium 4301-Me]|uniref:CPBP family intramembrane glutamic endopeptidase n=1 Tax=Pyranulibacter aquaticus TaxID=3163344 RepID=UPI003595BF69